MDIFSSSYKRLFHRYFTNDHYGKNDHKLQSIYKNEVLQLEYQVIKYICSDNILLNKSIEQMENTLKQIFNRGFELFKLEMNVKTKIKDLEIKECIVKSYKEAIKEIIEYEITFEN